MKVLAFFIVLIAVLCGATVAIMAPQEGIAAMKEVGQTVMSLFGSAPVTEVVEPVAEAASAAVSTL